MIPTTIKPFLLLLTLLFSLSSNAQSIEIKLKAEVLKSETEEAIKTGRKPTDLQFASLVATTKAGQISNSPLHVNRKGINQG
jgi:hypothetical protein